MISNIKNTRDLFILLCSFIARLNCVTVFFKGMIQGINFITTVHNDSVLLFNVAFKVVDIMQSFLPVGKIPQTILHSRTTGQIGSHCQLPYK